MIRATPLWPSKKRPIVEPGTGYFDTALVDLEGQGCDISMEGILVVQVRVIFVLPVKYEYRQPLVYIEFFTGTHVLSAHSRMYQVRRAYRAQERKAAVIRLDCIRSGCHLIPKFGLEIDNSWTATNVLEKCSSFYVNTFLSPYFFQVLSVPASLESVTETDEAETDLT